MISQLLFAPCRELMRMGVSLTARMHPVLTTLKDCKAQAGVEL